MEIYMTAAIIGLAVAIFVCGLHLIWIKRNALANNRRLLGRIWAYEAWLIDRRPLSQIEDTVNRKYAGPFDAGALRTVLALEELLQESLAAKALDRENGE